MSRTKTFMYNTISTGILQIITMIAGFIVPRIMLIYYGSEVNGLVSSITQFISYFNLVEAGLASAAIYALYKPISEKNYKGINEIISAAKNFYFKSGYIFIGLVIGLSIIYPFFVESELVSNIEIAFLVLVLGINGVLEFFTLAKYRVLLSADQKVYIISIATTIHIVINTIIVIILSMLNINIVLLRALATISIFIRTIILTIYCRKKYKFLNYSEKPNEAALNKRWDALFLQILGVVHTGTPIILITIIIRDLKIVSIYTIFNMVIAGINGVLSIFINGLYASFGEIIAKNEIKTLQKAYSEFEFIYYILLSIVYSITFLMFMPFIKVYTFGISDINYNLPILGFLFVLNGLLYNIKTPQGMLVISAGLYKETKKQTIIQGILAIVLGAILAKYIGIYGVIIGSIISNLYRDVDLVMFIPKNVTKLDYRITIKRIFRIFLSVFISTFLLKYIEFKSENLIEWMLLAFIVSVLVTMLSLILNFIFDKKEFLNVINRLRKVILIKNGKNI